MHPMSQLEFHIPWEGIKVETSAQFWEMLIFRPWHPNIYHIYIKLMAMPLFQVHILIRVRKTTGQFSHTWYSITLQLQRCDNVDWIYKNVQWIIAESSSVVFESWTPVNVNFCLDQQTEIELDPGFGFLWKYLQTHIGRTVFIDTFRQGSINLICSDQLRSAEI